MQTITVPSSFTGKTTRRTLRALLKAFIQTARERRQLADLDQRALRDIGIARHDAQIEANRRFFDLPTRY